MSNTAGSEWEWEPEPGPESEISIRAFGCLALAAIVLWVTMIVGIVARIIW